MKSWKFSERVLYDINIGKNRKDWNLGHHIYSNRFFYGFNAYTNEFGVCVTKCGCGSITENWHSAAYTKWLKSFQSILQPCHFSFPKIKMYVFLLRLLNFHRHKTHTHTLLLCNLSFFPVIYVSLSIIFVCVLMQVLCINHDVCKWFTGSSLLTDTEIKWSDLFKCVFFVC